jgi:hypothetical protein
MKTIFIAAMLLICPALAQQASKEQYNKLLNELEKRVQVGDYEAIREVGKLPIDVAMPWLNYYILPKGILLDRRKIAIETAHTFKGKGEYFRKRYGDPYRKDAKFNDELLAAIGGDEMGAVVAPFLFNTYPAPPSEIGSFDIVVHTSTATLAIMTLGDMKLPDNPYGASSNRGQNFGEENKRIWQTYVVKKGWVEPPQGWQPVPLPAGAPEPIPTPQYKIAYVEPTPPRPEPVAIKEPQQPKPQAQPPIEKQKPEGINPTYFVFGGIAALSLILLAIIYRKMGKRENDER